jgi:aminoglycoside 3-N-acetyltransferase
MSSLLVEEIKTYAGIFVKRLLPRGAVQRLRGLARMRARSRRRRASAHRRAAFTRRRLASDLSALGLRPDQDVLIHAAFSALGPVEDGPAGVVNAICDVVGPNATILAPAYPMSGTMHEWMTNPEPFDVRTSRSCMGAISEYMRSLPEARRSAHPTHSVVAIGPCADAYTARHHECETPAGPLSPFWLHMRKGGGILCLGSGIGKVTSYHVIEDLVPDFPVDVYCAEPFDKLVVFEDGSRRHLRTLINDPDLSPWRVDNFKPKEEEILDRLRQCGGVRIGQVGDALSHLMNAAILLELMRGWLRTGVTIYHRPRWGFPSRRMQAPIT